MSTESVLLSLCTGSAGDPRRIPGPGYVRHPADGRGGGPAGDPGEAAASRTGIAPVAASGLRHGRSPPTRGAGEADLRPGRVPAPPQPAGGHRGLSDTTGAGSGQPAGFGVLQPWGGLCGQVGTRFGEHMHVHRVFRVSGIRNRFPSPSRPLHLHLPPPSLSWTRNSQAIYERTYGPIKRKDILPGERGQNPWDRRETAPPRRAGITSPWWTGTTSSSPGKN